MRTRLLGVAAAAFVVTALMAGCTSQGSTRASSPAPSSSAAASTQAPAATSVSPAAGSLVAGEKATIEGADLTGVTRVTFGDQEATDVTVVSPTQVTLVVPHAVNYQPGSAAVTAYKGTVAVAATKPLTYTWAVQTGVDKEMQYAFAHWNTTTYNPAYYDFNAVGGDCQNFVSQSLLARGLATTAGWFYTSQSSHSESWGYAPSFNSYLAANPKLGFTKLTSDQRSQLSVGDLAYFDWNHNGVPDHTMIVSGVSTVNGVTKVTLVGHNLDSDYRDLDTAITVDHPGATVWFWKVPASL
ncbi:amidase domain-containing protein [Frondihabitans cladoniiphilus]|uniref:IPT/TIG domain-containing protein n=1 Tax=Frondihabitans cladoniiphilus TaxID=715785 RepID=A0ABP8W3A1_9MICO